MSDRSRDVIPDDPTDEELAAMSAAAAGEDESPDRESALLALHAAFADAIAADDVEVLPEEGEDRSDVAVAGETWTLYLSGWPGPAQAFIAIEDEPDDGATPAAIERAWRAAVPETALAALSMADAELGGAITAALVSTGDPLSAAVAATLRA